jgi:hyperosmotically inducible protein
MKNKYGQRIVNALLAAVIVCFVAGNVSAQEMSENKEQKKETRIEAKANLVGGQNQSDKFAQTRPPRRLVPEIRNELLTLPYYSVFDWIEFEVDKKGVVTLRGQVTTPPDTKSHAEAYVKDIDGVTRVVNNIEVLPLSPSDDRLRQALYREIYSGPLFRYQVGSLQSIHIIVKNGRATLKGVVDSEGDKNIAGIRAKTVSGLFEVNNELVVRDDKEKVVR